MKMFDIEGPIYRFMTTLMNMFILSMCWIVGTIIGLGLTIGVSTVAASDIGLKMVDNKEGYVVRQFIKSYKKNFKQGLPLGIMSVVAFYTVFLDFELFNKIENATIFLLIWGFLSGAIFFCGFVYSFALSARYANTLKNTITNSFRIATRYFGRTFLLLIILVIETAAFAWNLMMIFISIIIGPACIILTVCMFAGPIFKDIQKKNTEDGIEYYDDPDSNEMI
ncbi:MAG: DUF624 domain-containing protein [Eubacterium sp.]|nr:DUF624 domain-containing protein [Eubacterium sp.]